jgi:ATP-dependent DNA helicase DinG
MDDEAREGGGGGRGGVKALDAAALREALEPGGAAAARLDCYEARTAQLDLMSLVVKGFNDDALVAAEAGTGVGKSLAYLLPAVNFALAVDERVVISTATITLQQQLFEKDIPLVASALRADVKAALIKGRGNFLCRRRLEDALRESDSLLAGIPEGSDELNRIALWAGETRTGDRSELAFAAREGLWASVCSESDVCLGPRCRHRESCFVMELRRLAAEARILVVNHHLLFADLAARAQGAGYEVAAVLPPYCRVILDEAHTIEHSATSFFSESWSRLSLQRVTSRLYGRRGAAKRGLLLRLQAHSSGPDGSEEWEAMIERIRGAAQRLNEAALLLCGAESAFRLVPEREELVKERLAPSLAALKERLGDLTASIGALVESVERQEGTDAEKTGDAASLVREVSACKKRLAAIARSCGEFADCRGLPGDVLWIERRSFLALAAQRDDDWALFTKAPVDIAPRLQEALFEPNKTVVCLSATLTVADSFAYWESRVGIGLARNGKAARSLLRGRFPSPFPYARSVLLAVPSDAPLPEEAAFRAFVNDGVLRLVEASGGSALVLFTSFESLNGAYRHAEKPLREQGIRCLRQGDGDRSRLLKTFLEDKTSALFATDSFWEGVDAPGDTLKLVILCRLPFKTPNDPVFEARCEAILRRGANPFMELSVPEAVMKFRQGFGRLIRRSSDSGVVAVLDGRVIKKRYGAVFLQSLPETKTSFADFKSILTRVEFFCSGLRR